MQMSIRTSFEHEAVYDVSLTMVRLGGEYRLPTPELRIANDFGPGQKAIG